MRKFIVLAFVVLLTSCSKEEVDNFLGGLTDSEIGSGLRQALDFGVKNQVSKLTAKNGYYENELVKILLPKEIQKAVDAIRKAPLVGNFLADKIVGEGVKAINRTAEDAVKTATPIFVKAIKEITFDDAKKILLGNEKEATNYLEGKTHQALYKEFNPVIKTSFTKVGADEIWKDLVEKYNDNLSLLQLVDSSLKPMNADLTDYVTNEALKGVFTMIAVEEKGIRTNIENRTTDLLKKVFKLQDTK